MSTKSIIVSINSTTTVPNNSTIITLSPFLNPVSKIKIGMAVGMLVSVFIVTLIPFFVLRCLSKKWNENRNSQNIFRQFKIWMSRINCFAGGVFLSTGFMDIFVEMLESVDEAKLKNQIVTPFPLGPFMTLIGFFMILIIEESVTFIKSAFFSSPSEQHVTDDESLGRKNDKQLNQSLPTFRNRYQTFDDQLPRSSESDLHVHDHSADHKHHDHHEHELDEEALSRGNIAVTILMIAISIHSIFEGLALGLEKDSAGASRLFLALSLHKYIIAITIGLKVSNSTLGVKMACLCSAIFAIATPLGVVLGFWVIYLEEVGDTSFSLVAAVLQGIACGTFFYIVFFEILPEEFGKKKDKCFKILFLILGFLLVSLVMYLVHE